ncbi:MAG: DNA mismatch repair endonuclease MutL [Clostridiales bacterium]|jgi:DNA mismatch repair protein MutL|nr:DNA mismatch repair endonuclease MutL [Clostridiales bacterium]
MPNINILDSSVYNKISAGEVVERPASVVKELVENSIDAGADNIAVEIFDGGLKSIKVADNGFGMDGENLKKAFLPHATSKILRAEDLFTVSSLGFRGEALASIAAVGLVEAVSKTEEADAASRMEIVDGIFGEIGCAAANRGTSITVKDLFYNAKPRLNFLKRAKTEESYISALLAKFILAYPDISFTYKADGKTVYQTKGLGLKNAVYEVYGREISDNLMSVEYRENASILRGYISVPGYYKPNRTYQTTFINGRIIENQTVSLSVLKAYGESIMKRCFPIFVLDLVLPFNDVDVNAHPTKNDVRFADEKRVFSFVFRAVQGRVSAYIADGEKEFRGVSDGENSVNIGEKRSEKDGKNDQNIGEKDGENGQNTGKKRGENGENIDEKHGKNGENIGGKRGENGQNISEKDGENGQNTGEKHGKNGENIGVNSEIKRVYSPALDLESIRNLGRSKEVSFGVRPKNLKNKLSESSSPIGIFSDFFSNVSDEQSEIIYTQSGKADLRDERTYVQNEKTDTQNERTYPQSGKADFDDEVTYAQNEKTDTRSGNKSKTLGFIEHGRLVGQVLNCYVIFEYLGEIYLVDQHAIHERVNYDRLSARAHSADSQIFLTPYVFSVNHAEKNVLDGLSEYMRELGFDIEYFGGGDFKISAAPVDIDLRKFIADLLSEIKDTRASKDYLTEKIIQTACKSSIKSGDGLNDSQLFEFVKLLKKHSDMTPTCPHGRPVFVKMTRTELDKMFKRIV